MTTETLADLIRYIGIGVALLGSLAAVPAASWGIARGIRDRAERIARRLLRRPKSVPAHIGVAAGTITISGHARGIVQPGPSATVEERLAHLQREVLRLDGEFGRVDRELSTETAERKAEDERVAGELRAEVARLERELDRRESETVQINARALPVVGLGIVLSGIPLELARWWPLGVASVIVGVALAVYALVLVIKGRPPKVASS